MLESHFSKSSVKAKYFDNNPNQKIVENIKPTSLDLDKVEINNDEYEIWLVQCPVNINLQEQLQNQSIKLPGKTRLNNIETISEEFSNPKPITLGCKSSDNEFSIKTLSALGRILIREKLNIDCNENTEDAVDQDSGNIPILTVDMLNLKQRHPLLGADFEDKLTLNEDVTNRLKHCDEIQLLKIKQEIKAEVDDDNYVVPEKTKKKKKRKVIDDQQEIHVKPKKIKEDVTSANEENSLAWIKDL